MSKLLELLVSLSVAGSSVVICILLLRLVSPRVFPATWRYALGKLAVGFYLLPIAFGIRWISSFFTFNTTAASPIMNIWPATVQHALNVQHALPGQSAGFIPGQVTPEHIVSPNVVLPLISLWGIGALAFALWQMYGYGRFLKILKHTRTAVPENSEAAKQLALMKEALGMQSNVQLAYSSAIRSPVLVGLWKPTIYLPAKNIMNVDITMVIHHELVHLKRKDLWVKAMTLVVSAWHWFNPFVHILRKEIHTWSELSCDEEVVKEMSHAERKRYGETILNVVAGSKDLPVQFCATLSSNGKQLKRRLNMMLHVQKLKKQTVIMMAAAVIAVGTISTSTAVWASKHVPEVETEINNVVKEEVGGSTANTHVSYIGYSALSDYEQEVATKDVAKYYVDAEGRVIDHRDGELVSFDALSAEEQQRVSVEDGYFPDNLLTPQEVRQRMLEDNMITEEEFERLNGKSDTKLTKGADNSIQYKDAGDSILYNGVQFVKYRALTPDEQKFVTERGLMGIIYSLKGYEHPVLVDELTPEEQSQVTKEEGYYSPESIARLKESYEKYPPGVSVTKTYEEDPSIPPGMSVTIRTLTPEEVEELEKIRAENPENVRAFFEQLK